MTATDFATTRERPDPYGPRRRSIPSKSPPIQANASARSQTDLLNAALKAMLYERPEEARECLEALASPEALEAREPLAVDGLAYLSSVRWSIGDVAGAMDASDRALELGPERFAPNQKAGEMALRLGDMEKAAELFLTALRASEPGTADAKAAEASLRETRRRVTRGIRHEAKAPRLTGWLSRFVSRRRGDQSSGSVTAG